jgi:crotonobetainyl-CoA:carnitine CoA-transferase CaiB-like acyl-CoA transferase
LILEPYTVLDFTDDRGELGPMLMGDLGADVIRVEPPAGSAARQAKPVLTAAQEKDLASLSYLAFNRNKRSLQLDPDSAPDCETLQALIARSHFIFEPWPASPLAAYGVDFETARALNPRIIYVRISPWGADGPHADYLGNDLVLAAMGGPVALQGSADRAPVRLSVPQVWRHAGVEAASGAMAAHHRMLRTGEAQYVDLSAQSVMTWTMLNAMDAHAIQGAEFQRGGGLDTGLVRIDMIHPCADGHVLALPNSKVILGCMSWMVEDGVVDAAFADTVNWAEYDLNTRNPDYGPFNVQKGIELCRAFFVNHKKLELFEYGLAHGFTIAPINSLPELLQMEHLDFREYWEPMTLPDRQNVRAPGLWGKSHQNILSLRRPAPGLGEHSEEVLAELAQPVAPVVWPEADGALPFEGITVADFSWVGVGPISAKYLADHGARVIRIESETRPDVLRGGAPFKDGVPGLDRSQFFGDFNTSKQSLTLNMKLPEAIEIAREVIKRSDVMIESFAAGAIHRLGLNYDEMKKINPGLIKISTCLMGQTGPAAAMAGYGYHAGAIAGFYEVTGWPDLAPTGPWVAYTDTVAPRFITILLAAALDHRRRTGEGCYVDVAQIEAALHFLGPELLDLQASGFAASRNGNRARFNAPQGCYRTNGPDNWCAIAVDTDEQWQRLCEEMGRQDLARDAALADHAGRLANHDRIDEAISNWTADQEAHALMHRLQGAGVPAGVVQRSRELLEDPQYAHRNFYRYFDHPVMGHIPYAGHQYRISSYDNAPRGAAPTLGQHSFELLSGFLGFDDERIADAYASGAVA